MAVRSEAWSGTRTQVGAIVRPAAQSRPLTREERVARIQRRRRLSRVQGAVEGRFLAVAVEDGGAGVDEVTRLRLFEPLVTTKPTGIGLGLSLVKRILERHGGTVAYEPRQRGARFVVRLPAALGAA